MAPNGSHCPPATQGATPVRDAIIAAVKIARDAGDVATIEALGALLLSL